MRDEYIPIDNNPGLSRHVNSMAVVNTNIQARARYVAQRDKILNEKQLLVGAMTEVNNLRKDLDDLKKVVEMCLMRQPLNN